MHRLQQGWASLLQTGCLLYADTLSAACMSFGSGVSCASFVKSLLASLEASQQASEVFSQISVFVAGARQRDSNVSLLVRESWRTSHSLLVLREPCKGGSRSKGAYGRRLRFKDPFLF
jgi:hypothetical protein